MKLSNILPVIFIIMSLNAVSKTFMGYSSCQSVNTPFEQNNKYDVVNKEGKYIDMSIYDKLSDVSCGLIQVELNNKIGFVNTMGNIKIPFIYDVDSNNAVGLSISRMVEFDKNNEVSKETILAGVDNQYINFQGGLCAVCKNGKYGFIDTLGKVILPFIYDAADNFFQDYAIVKLKSKYGVIDKFGILKIPFIYDSLIWDRSERSIFANKNNEISFIKL
jgi:hypothetical protein